MRGTALMICLYLSWLLGLTTASIFYPYLDSQVKVNTVEDLRLSKIELNLTNTLKLYNSVSITAVVVEYMGIVTANDYAISVISYGAMFLHFNFVDGLSNIYLKEIISSSTSSSELDAIGNDIKLAFGTEYSGIQPDRAVICTWTNMPYVGAADNTLLNSWQVTITQDSEEKQAFVIMSYDPFQWFGNESDYSGNPLVGYMLGEAWLFLLPGSYAPEFTEYIRAGNGGKEYQWIIRIDFPKGCVGVPGGLCCMMNGKGFEVQCVCYEGYDGEKCQNNVTSSAESCPTVPDPLCIYGNLTSDNCTCDPGYTGQICDVTIVEQACVNGTMKGDDCNCDPGFTGRACDVAIVEQACVNGTMEGDDCSCHPGFTGRACDVAMQCINGTVTDDNCTCIEGFTGASCDVLIEPCEIHPGKLCVNGTQNGYECVCSAGFTGPNCSEPIDNCTPSLCSGLGTCVSLPKGYLCLCVPGVSGTDCTVDNRPPVGTFNEWSAWSTCSKSCGTGMRTRYRQCRRTPCNEINVDSSLCTSESCPSDPEGEAYGALLRTYRTLSEIVKGEASLLSTLAQIMDEYCVSNPDKCCQSVTSSAIKYTPLLTADNVHIIDGYPLRVSTIETHIKFVIKVSTSVLVAACTSDSTRRRRQADDDVMYLQAEILEEALENNLEKLNSDEAVCCFTLDNSRNVSNIPSRFWIQLLVPTVLILVIILTLLGFLTIQITRQPRIREENITDAYSGFHRPKYGLRYSPTYSTQDRTFSSAT